MFRVSVLARLHTCCTVCSQEDLAHQLLVLQCTQCTQCTLVLLCLSCCPQSKDCRLTHHTTNPSSSHTQGTLAQIGLMEPGQPDVVVLAVLLTFFGGAMLLGSAQTLNGLRSGTMSIR